MTSGKQQHLSRRTFLSRTARIGVGALALPTIVPASALGRDGTVVPSNRVAVGFIGVGGKGTGGMGNFMTSPHAQPVAVCDVDARTRERARKIAGLAPEAAYNDFRELLARDDIDAVQVATPDHWHVLASIAAVESGRDVYCEKPLSNTIAEGRALVEAVERNGAIFQHGTQLRSLRNVRFACELVRNGRIGELKTVTIGSPPGHVTGLHPAEPVPDWLDYDLWLGPAPEEAYTQWRVKSPLHSHCCWYFVSDYSLSGWVAGFGVHDIDIAHWGMDAERTGPVEIEGEGVFPGGGLFDTVLTYRLEFQYANGVKIVMTSTDQNPHGVRFEGTEGWVFTRGGIDAEPKSLLKEEIGPSEIRLYESIQHEHNFVDCVRSRARTLTPIDVAHRSTSVCLLGGIALKLRRKLRWDPARERFLDDPEADRFLSYAMRAPWRL